MLQKTVISQAMDLDIPKTAQKNIGKEVAGSADQCIEWINIFDIELPDVQRDLNFRDVVKYINDKGGIDWNLFGIPTVWKKPGHSKYKLLNGQHRITGVVVFLPHITSVKCHVIETDDDEYAAGLFADMNGLASRQLNADQLFWSAYLGRKPEALYHASILQRADVRVGKVNQDDAYPDRKNIKYANFKKALAHGEDNTIRAIELCRDAYPDNEIKNVLMAALALLFSVEQYAGLGDPTTKLGRAFEDWFLTLASLTPYNEFGRYDKYKNSSQWHYGVAYGLYQQFASIARGRKGMPNPPKVDYIKNLYLNNGGSDDDEQTQS